MITRVVVVALAVVPAFWAGAGRADPVVNEFTYDHNQQVPPLNAASCTDETDRILRIVINGLTLTSYPVRFVRYTGSATACPTDMLDPNLEVVEDFRPFNSPNNRMDETIHKKDKDLIGATDCAGEGGRASFLYCAQVVANEADPTAVVAPSIRVDYDTSLPPIPDIQDITSADGSVLVDISPVETQGETFNTVVQFRQCGVAVDGGSTDASECNSSDVFSEATSDTFTVEIGSLKNGEEIELRALFEDDFGNRGKPTSLHVASPQQTLGPLSLYDGADNPVSCDASCADYNSAATAAFLLVLSKRVRRRLARVSRAVARRSSSLVALLLVVGALVAGQARADFGQLTVGMDVAPYKPAIDTERSGHGFIFPIYDCFFGGAQLVNIGGDIDTHLWDGFGSLQFSTGLSLAQAQGFAQPGSARETGTCQKHADTEVQLTFMIVRPGLTYRFDPFLDWFAFPLVPYARLGGVVAGYAFTKDGDFDNGGMNPVGLRFGVEGALGLMIALDFLDSLDPFVPDATRRARASGVFDHTFFFAEGAAQDVTTFGQPGLVLTPEDDFLGTKWPVLWKAGVAVELL